ncbi:MAG: ferritin family protein [Oscillospiraceae bacterium]|jgi:rubrerythrin
MENGKEQYGLDHFETVWARVNGTEEKTEVSPIQHPEEVLSFMIEAERESIAVYTALAGRIGGSTGQVLTRIANEEREHLRRLELELFLCSGKVKHHLVSTHRIKGILTELRTAYAAEQESSQRYQLACAAALQPELRKLYAELAEAEAQHAMILRRIIGRMMI